MPCSRSKECLLWISEAVSELTSEELDCNRPVYVTRFVILTLVISCHKENLQPHYFHLFQFNKNCLAAIPFSKCT